MPTVLKCSNCGASIAPNQSRCDYCGLFFDLPKTASSDDDPETDFEKHLDEEKTRLEIEVESFKPILYEGYTITKELDLHSLTLYFWGEKPDGLLNFEDISVDKVQRKINHYETSSPRRQRLIRAYNRSGIY